MKHKIKTRRKRNDNIAFSQRDLVCKKIIEYGILGVIVWSPLPAASVYDWSILVIEIAVLVMVAAYLLMKESPQNNELLSLSLKWPRYLFVGLFVFIFIQIIPLPNFIVKIFSPNIYSFQNIFSSDFSKIKFMSLSLIPSHTLREGLELLSYFLFGFLIVKTITRRQQIMRIFYVLVIMGIFEAFYGMFELYSKNPRILFYKKIYGLDSVSGTFVNRNHLSGYLEMIIPLAIGLIIARVDFFSLAGLKWRGKVLRLSQKGFSTNLILTAGIIVMSLAIIFSKSRSGVFLLIFAFILFFELTVLYFGRVRHQQKGVKNFLKVSFLIIIFISFYVGINATVERFALDKLPNEGRLVYWSNATSIVRDFPLLGTGLGTFASVYPAYEESSLSGHLSHAHNDYLEYLSELGVVGMILLSGGIAFMVVSSFLIWRVRRHPEVKGLAMGSIVAIVVILIHSIADFNLHIPANMVLFTVVLSMTAVTAFYKRSEKNKSKGPNFKK
jgi:O-antigen ligase